MKGKYIAGAILLLFVVGACWLMHLKRQHEAAAAAARQEAARAYERLVSRIEKREAPFGKQIRKIAPGLYELDRIQIDARHRQLQFDAAVNMRDGLIEVVVCTPYGKTHESVLVAPIRPLYLHACCLLLGLKNGPNPEWELPPDISLRPPGWNRPPGSTLAVYAAWKTPEGPKEVPLGELLMDHRTSETLDPAPWVFTGSIEDSRGGYLADRNGSLITNYHDPLAVIDCQMALGRVDDFTFANSQILPPVGTTVTVRLAPEPSDKFLREKKNAPT